MLYFGTSVFLLCTCNRHRVFDYVQNVFGYVYLITMPLRMQGFGTDINVQTCKKRMIGMTRNFLNRFYTTLAEQLNKCILLANLLVKIVYLVFKSLYCRSQLCYKRVLLQWECLIRYTWLG